MSDTPKTDSAEAWSDNVGMGILVVPAREMRQVEKQLAEARAEIENKQYSITCDAERIQLLCETVEEQRAEIERLKAKNTILDSCIADMAEEQAALCAEDQSITELVASKDRLIEQMRRAIEKVVANFRVNLRDLTEFEEKQVRILEAALAAERGERL